MGTRMAVDNRSSCDGDAARLDDDVADADIDDVTEQAAATTEKSAELEEESETASSSDVFSFVGRSHVVAWERLHLPEASMGLRALLAQYPWALIAPPEFLPQGFSPVAALLIGREYLLGFNKTRFYEGYSGVPHPSFVQDFQDLRQRVCRQAGILDETDALTPVHLEKIFWANPDLFGDAGLIVFDGQDQTHKTITWLEINRFSVQASKKINLLFLENQFVCIKHMRGYLDRKSGYFCGFCLAMKSSKDHARCLRYPRTDVRV